MASSRQRLRSGGRSEQVRLAVGCAVLDLLGEGEIDFTTVDVAERAGVSRGTIYRWWPRHADLLAEALDQHARTVEVPDTGAWRSDVHEFAHRIAAFAAAPVDLALARLIASGRYPELGEAVTRHFAPVMEAWRGMLTRAVARGDAHDRHSSATVINTLVAPLFLAPLTLGGPSDPEVIDRIVALVLDATALD